MRGGISRLLAQSTPFSLLSLGLADSICISCHSPALFLECPEGISPWIPPHPTISPPTFPIPVNDIAMLPDGQLHSSPHQNLTDGSSAVCPGICSLTFVEGPSFKPPEPLFWILTAGILPLSCCCTNLHGTRCRSCLLLL